MDAERGQATIESTALAALIALLLVAVIALIASGGEVKAGRELAGVIGRRIACAPHLHLQAKVRAKLLVRLVQRLHAFRTHFAERNHLQVIRVGEF